MSATTGAAATASTNAASRTRATFKTNEG
jgi:hypothetical protein